MIKVELIAYSQLVPGKGNMVEKINASAANLCYNPVGASEILKDMTEDKAGRLTRMVVKNNHHSTIEHVSFTFAIEGISRACSHQLVRHRIASYSQQSQRYVKANSFKQKLIVPNSIKVDQRANAIFRYVTDIIADGYNELLLLGIPAEDARFILPNAADTKIVVTMNARSLLHFFEERCCQRAQWEIRELANMMLAECRKVAPVLFEKAGPSCVAKGFCKEGNHGCGRMKKVVQ